LQGHEPSKDAHGHGARYHLGATDPKHQGRGRTFEQRHAGQDAVYRVLEADFRVEPRTHARHVALHQQLLCADGTEHLRRCEGFDHGAMLATREGKDVGRALAQPAPGKLHEEHPRQTQTERERAESGVVDQHQTAVSEQHDGIKGAHAELRGDRAQLLVGIDPLH